MVSHGSKFSRNILFLWGALGVRLTLAFVFVPSITASLGASRYGVWGILFQIINYLALLDFGFEKAIINFVATALGRRDHDGVSRVIATSTRLYFWFGLAAAILSAGAAIIILPGLKLESSDLLTEAQWALVLIGLFSAIRFWFVPVTAALGGFQRYDSLTLIGVVEDVLRTVTMIFLLNFGHGLVALAGTVLGFGLLRQLISIWWLKRVFPDWKIRTEPEPSLTKELFAYSRITFAISLAWMVIYNTDSLLLGFFASTIAAGIYNPATQLAGYLRHLANAIGTPLTAAVAHAKGASELESAKGLYLKLFNYASYGGFAVTALVATFAHPLVTLWLPSGFGDTARVMVILAIGTAVFVPHILTNAMLFAVGRHRVILYTVILEAGLKLILAALMVKPMGAVGMAMANSIPQIICYVAIYPFFAGRSVGVTAIDLLWSQCRSGVLALVFTMVPAYLMTMVVPPTSWLGLVLGATVSTFFAATGLLVVLDSTDRERVRRIFGFS